MRLRTESSKYDGESRSSPVVFEHRPLIIKSIKSNNDFGGQVILVVNDALVSVTYLSATEEFLGEIPGLAQNIIRPKGSTIPELAEKAMALIQMMRMQEQDDEQKRCARKAKKNESQRYALNE